MTDLDRMKEKWTEYDRKLEESVRLNRRILSTITLQSGRSRLHRMLRFTVASAGAWLVCIVALGEFIYGHRAAPRFALAGAALDVYSAGFLIGLIQQVRLVHGIDYGQPMAAIQRQIESVRVLRVRTTQWGVLVGTVAWTPFLIVVSEAFFGVDIYRVLGMRWVGANLIFGLALIPVTIWISKEFGNRMAASPFVQRIMRDLAGRSLNEAAEFLATISEFEKE
jgi:hypothetical protein